jgi:hypothetical protein
MLKATSNATPKRGAKPEPTQGPEREVFALSHLPEVNGLPAVKFDDYVAMLRSVAVEVDGVPRVNARMIAEWWNIEADAEVRGILAAKEGRNSEPNPA